MSTSLPCVAAPITFQFQPHNIRVLAEAGEPWFCAADVCAVLGYVNSRKALADHCRAGGVTKRDTPTTSGIQPLTFINEGNLYRLILKSRKPEAETFEAWVCEEVLPSLRKTGRYEVPVAPHPSPPEYLSHHDEATLSRLCWRLTQRLACPKSVAHAFWYRLRRVAGVPAPGRFEVRHLPALAAELVRIQAVVEAFNQVQYQATQRLVKRVLRTGEDPAPILDALAKEFDETLLTSDADLQARLAPWMTRELAELTPPPRALPRHA